MKVVRIKIWARFAASFCLVLAILANSSMFVLASPDGKTLLGEIIITGKSENGEMPYARVNGEKAISGRTFPSYSMIETPAAATAVLSLGSLGQIGISPESSLVLSFGENSITAKVLSGHIRVLSSEGVSVKIETLDNALNNNSKLTGIYTIDVRSGKTVAVAENGELFDKNGEPAGAAQTQTTATGGGGAWIPVAVFVAIVATAVVYVAVNQGDEDDDFVVSPVR